jgi:hypothetical protein
MNIGGFPRGLIKLKRRNLQKFKRFLPPPEPESPARADLVGPARRPDHAFPSNIQTDSASALIRIGRFKPDAVCQARAVPGLVN